MNLLLDTNVLIDYLGRKDPFFSSAQKVVIAGFFGDARLWVPSQSVVDAFYVLNRYVDSARLQAAILKALTVIEPVDLTGASLERAARLGWDDLEDCPCCREGGGRLSHHSRRQGVRSFNGSGGVPGCVA